MITMYNPEEAKKSYLSLFKENGVVAGFQSAFAVISWYVFNEYIFDLSTPIFVFIIGFFLFAVYFTWKPKLIRFLRGYLRGTEYRDKAD